MMTSFQYSPKCAISRLNLYFDGIVRLALLVLLLKDIINLILCEGIDIDRSILLI